MDFRVKRNRVKGIGEIADAPRGVICIYRAVTDHKDAKHGIRMEDVVAAI